MEFVSVQDINFAAGTQSGRQTFTARNGDQIVMVHSGRSVPAGPGPLRTVAGHPAHPRVDFNRSRLRLGRVYPAAGMVPIAKESGAALIIVNAEPTPFDPVADAVLRGSISEILPAIVEPL